MLPVAHIKTTTTELNFLTHARNGFRKIGYYRRFLFQQVQYQSQGGFAANSRKAGELGYGIFQQNGRKRHRLQFRLRNKGTIIS
jgi:hypothetical protein